MGEYGPQKWGKKGLHPQLEVRARRAAGQQQVIAFLLHPSSPRRRCTRAAVALAAAADAAVLDVTAAADARLPGLRHGAACVGCEKVKKAGW